MPIYAYKCQSCGHAKDVLQKMSDAQLTDCPACGQGTFTKQLTAAGFQLKGSGWYVTDFRDGAAKKTDGAGDGQAAKAPASDAAAPVPAPANPPAAAAPTPAPASPAPSAAKTFRKWLLAGLLVIVPLGITVWVLEWIVSSLDKTLLILPAGWHPKVLLNVDIPGFGVLLAFGILLSVGALASNFLGRKLVAWWDKLLNRIPVVRGIYSGVKQVSDTLFSEKGNAFRKAVLVQWPRPDVWTVAFLTGTPSGDVAQQLALTTGTADEFVSVYVPTTPNPTGGYFVLLKASDCIELKMSVDEALKYVISMGVVAPVEHAKSAELAQTHHNSN